MLAILVSNCSRLERHREVFVAWNSLMLVQTNELLHPLRCHFCIRLFKTNMAPQPKSNISEAQDAETIHIIYSDRNIKFNKYT